VSQRVVAIHTGWMGTRLDLVRANVLPEERHRKVRRKIAWVDGTTESAALRLVIDNGLSAMEVRGEL
jgi:hypothetical protein